jgi:hypothetical protein
MIERWKKEVGGGGRVLGRRTEARIFSRCGWVDRWPGPVGKRSCGECNSKAQLARTEATGARKIEIGFPEEWKCPVKRPCPMRVCNKERGWRGKCWVYRCRWGLELGRVRRVPQCRILRVSSLKLSVLVAGQASEDGQKRNSAARTNERD